MYSNDIAQKLSNICRWKPTRLGQYSYTIKTGNEYPLEGIALITTYKSHPQFFGYCYTCGCPLHSKNFCPVNQCGYCLQYGHSYKVCPQRVPKKL